jgi:hypothetical protein
MTAVAAHVYASFEGFACLLSDPLSLPTTHLAFTMWLMRGHLPLALLALGLSGSKCVVIGELQPQRDNLFGFYNLSGVRTMNLLHLTMHGHLSWPLFLAVGFWQLLTMPWDGKRFRQLPTCGSYKSVTVLLRSVLSPFRGVGTCPHSEWSEVQIFTCPQFGWSEVLAHNGLVLVPQ